MCSDGHTMTHKWKCRTTVNHLQFLNHSFYVCIIMTQIYVPPNSHDSLLTMKVNWEERIYPIKQIRLQSYFARYVQNDFFNQSPIVSIDSALNLYHTKHFGKLRMIGNLKNIMLYVFNFFFHSNKKEFFECYKRTSRFDTKDRQHIKNAM